MSIEIIWYKLQTNSLKAAQTVDDLLLEKDGRKSIFKIGITNAPEKRVAPGKGHMATRRELEVYANLGHDYGADQPWDEMYVVFETPTYPNAQAMEDILVRKYYWLAMPAGFTTLRCWNERGGGAGRIPRKGPYYVYVLFG